MTTLKQQLKEENNKKRLKLMYKRKFDKSLKSNIHILRFKVDLETRNKVLRICDKKEISISKFLRDILISKLNKTDNDSYWKFQT